MVQRDARRREHAQLRFSSCADALQGPCHGRLRRQQQEHRHRLRGRPDRQTRHPHRRRLGQYVEHCGGRADGAHLREHQGHGRLLCAACVLYQHDAQHVRLLRLRGAGGRAGRHAGRRARRLAGHSRGGQRLYRPHLRAARRRRQGADRARREPPRPAAAELYEGTRHGKRPLYAHRHRQRRRSYYGRRGGEGVFWGRNKRR